ncbi:MAG: hypothetical protein JST12_19260 [Armatimonadetes bacterium]|nr:hypothetical protein [Armatimonadota bacterium]
MNSLLLTHIKYVAKAFELADDAGFRPSNPRWDQWREAEARHFGVLVEDIPWYKVILGIRRFNEEEAERISECLSGVSLPEDTDAGTREAVQFLIRYGRLGGLEFGFVGKEFYLGEPGLLSFKT